VFHLFLALRRLTLLTLLNLSLQAFVILFHLILRPNLINRYLLPVSPCPAFLVEPIQTLAAASALSITASLAISGISYLPL